MTSSKKYVNSVQVTRQRSVKYQGN